MAFQRLIRAFEHRGDAKLPFGPLDLVSKRRQLVSTECGSDVEREVRERAAPNAGRTRERCF